MGIFPTKQPASIFLGPRLVGLASLKHRVEREDLNKWGIRIRQKIYGKGKSHGRFDYEGDYWARFPRKIYRPGSNGSSVN